MSRPELLDNVTHGDLRVRPFFGPGSGHDVNVARVFPVELRRLQAEFPLFLIKNAELGHFEPIALLGFAPGENLYLGQDGWDSTVLPLSIQRQPFLIGYQDSGPESGDERIPVVHIDLDHPAVSREEGEPLFLPQGGEAPLLEQASSVLKAIHEGHDALRSLSQLLVGLELVESVDLQLSFGDGSSQTLSGLSTVSEEKLATLGGGALAALHERGHLADVYMMLASYPALERLIERKNRLLTG